MIRILALIAAFCFLLPAKGQLQDRLADNDVTGELTSADQAAIRHVVETQLSALQHDDGALAFSFASPMIQRQLGTPERFLEMVKTAYPTVYRPRDMQFREIDATDDGPVQKVFFFAPDGQAVLGLYFMQQQPDRSWKINGCTLVSPPDIGI